MNAPRRRLTAPAIRDRALLERWYDIVHFSKMPRGGHFAALEQPALFVADVRAGLRGART